MYLQNPHSIYLLISNRKLPNDLIISLHTLLYASDLFFIKGLLVFRKMMRRVYGMEFVITIKKSKLVKKEITRCEVDEVIPMGRKVSLLLKVAKKNGLLYIPSPECFAQYKVRNIKNSLNRKHRKKFHQ